MTRDEVEALRLELLPILEKPSALYGKRVLIGKKAPIDRKLAFADPRACNQKSDYRLSVLSNVDPRLLVAPWVSSVDTGVSVPKMPPVPMLMPAVISLLKRIPPRGSAEAQSTRPKDLNSGPSREKAFPP